MKDSFKFGLAMLAICSLGQSAQAQTSTATTPAEMIEECKSLSVEFLAPARKCLIGCRAAASVRSTPEAEQQCKLAYAEFREKTQQAPVVGEVAIHAPHHVDSLVARFSERKGRLNRFELAPPEQSDGAKLAAKKCNFKLSQTALQTYANRNRPENRHIIQDIRARGQFEAFKLSNINWVEDGTRMTYDCQVEHLEVVGVDRY
ncbi:hypothetical protein [Hirschia litorea]|uniref:Uncharacterized protein n=1 Tax=Hirschia litorea TaxID=1199156 RepID=A0ABW2IL05_9PROT